MRTHKRAVGIIVQDEKILVFHRYKAGEWYYAFVGGGVESEETEEEAVIREMKEELNIDITINKLLFQQFVARNIRDEGREHYFYLITEFSGTPELSGPEKEHQTENNQYHPTWLPIAELYKYENLYPKEAREKVIELLG